MAQPGRLSPAEVGRAAPGKHADGGGLTLVVKPSGRRSWVARVVADGKRRDIGLGAYPAVSLAEARRRTAELRARAQLVDGRAVPNPAERVASVPTFASAAASVHALNAPRWRSERHSREWLDSLHRHAKPLMDLPADHITRAHVLEVLHPIWHDKPETVSRLAQRDCHCREGSRTIVFGYPSLRPAQSPKPPACRAERCRALQRCRGRRSCPRTRP